MLGIYENFPQTIHMNAYFSAIASNKKLQNALIKTLYKMNNETHNFNNETKKTVPQYLAIFEFGIAETDSFNYLDIEEANRVLDQIRKNPFQIMDLLCAIRYYKIEGERKKPLKFDYYLLRIAFDKGLVEIQIFHERGPRHIPPEEIINLIIKRVNDFFPRKILRPI